MPCHQDEIPADYRKNEIDQLILVAGGKIKIQEVGDNFMGKYPTAQDLVKKYRKKFKTFQYEVKGTTMVLVSPCPKKC